MSHVVNYTQVGVPINSLADHTAARSGIILSSVNLSFL